MADRGNSTPRNQNSERASVREGSSLEENQNLREHDDRLQENMTREYRSEGSVNPDNLKSNLRYVRPNAKRQSADLLPRRKFTFTIGAKVVNADFAR